MKRTNEHLVTRSSNSDLIGSLHPTILLTHQFLLLCSYYWYSYFLPVSFRTHIHYHLCAFHTGLVGCAKQKASFPFHGLEDYEASCLCGLLLTTLFH